jgi:hypothetical protein
MARSAPNTLTSSSAVPARSKCRVGFENRHRGRDKRRHVLSTIHHPALNDIRPFLHHVPTPHFVFGLVVDTTRGSTVLMCTAFLDPIAVEPKLVWGRRPSPSQIMDRERLKRQTFLLGLLDNRIRHAIEGCPGHRRIRVLSRAKQNREFPAQVFRAMRISSSDVAPCVDALLACPG